MKNEAAAKTADRFDWRWHAVEAKDREFDGAFYFGVQTTGIFCRPSCSSKMAKRQNVSFFITTTEAEKAGFRACMRCKPKEEYFPGAAAELIVKAFQILRSDETEVPTVEELSRQLNVTSGHLQKTFKTTMGLTPKEIVDMMRIENFKMTVRENDVTTSLYESGFGSSRSLYEKASERLGMTPATYKKGGNDMNIDYTIVDSRLGKLMVARTEKGICTVSFGSGEDELKTELGSEFFAAVISQNDAVLKEAVNAILKSLDGETAILNLPLDLRARPFRCEFGRSYERFPMAKRVLTRRSRPVSARRNHSGRWLVHAPRTPSHSSTRAIV